MMNKRASGKYLSIWWFFIITIIAVFIVSGNVVFFSKEINVKKLEAQIITERTVRCIARNNMISQIFFENNTDKILEYCGFNDKIDSEKYFLNIRIYKPDCFEKKECAPEKEFSFGNKAFYADCKVKKKIKAKKYPECYERYFYVLDENATSYIINIISASQNEGNKLYFKK